MSVNPWGRFKNDVVRSIEGALSRLGWQVTATPANTLEEPPDQKLGDLATRICFDLAKLQRQPPGVLATELGKEIKPEGLVERVEVAGNYVNFFVDISKLAEFTLRSIEEHDRSYGCSDVGQGKKVLIEHTSVNPTKPLHIGHGRNAVVGDTLARILRALGYRVEVQNYIDDMGRQVAETLLANRLIKKKPKAKFDHVLGLIYSDMHARIEREPGLEEEVRQILARLEQGTGADPNQARRLSERCVKANLETTDRLGISYDVLVWESDLVRSGILTETLQRLKSTKYLVEGTGEYAGALVLKLSDFGLEDKVLVRSDGTTVYTMRDIAYQLWKFGKTEAKLKFRLHSRRPDGTKTYTTSPKGRTNSRFGRADMVINVVGAEQRFPQQVVFNSLRALGFEKEYENSYHLAYEHVWLPSGRFSGRKGTWIGYTVDDVVEEAVARARAVVQEHAPQASESFKRRAAEFVGVGAVRYSLISTSPEKRITFKWEDALNFERNSGPAVQYSHARACSILRKAKKLAVRPISGVFQLPQEQRLVRLLAKFPEVVMEAGLRRQPHLPAIYAAELALAFNAFYEVAPVIDAETSELRDARLRLVNGVRVVLRNALELMGIKAPERM
ncbi:MAG: arginine--tRNA ligase [Candidatus Hadarchaeum sp.]|uniref:arginine--tRNA ligase n=1 Tax=Candidatus Hadarchaeum sp. TaxID=2883567 RepID=UPI003D117F27